MNILRVDISYAILVVLIFMSHTVLSFSLHRFLFPFFVHLTIPLIPVFNMAKYERRIRTEVCFPILIDLNYHQI